MRSSWLRAPSRGDGAGRGRRGGPADRRDGEAGAARDLVENGVNGFSVPAGDEDALATALRRMGEDAGFRAEAGARSLELTRRFTPEAWAEGVAGLASRLAANS